jgi:hypothetical protein
MKVTISRMTGAATIFALAALGPSHASSQSSSTQSGSAQQQQVTVVGCVQPESEFRKAKDAGRGGAAGTGIGAGNEFVLVNASASKGTTTDTTFELTGANEGQVKSFVGKRVEIMGTLKAAETGSARRPTGGATVGRPPEGVDVASKDLQLRELEVSSVKEASGTCPAK